MAAIDRLSPEDDPRRYDGGSPLEWEDDGWDGLRKDEPSVKIPEVSNHNEGPIITSAARLAFLGLGVAVSAAGVAATVKHVKRRKAGE